MPSPLLFIIVMEALSRWFDDRGLPWELLYVDDLVLLADLEDDLKRKLQRWKNGFKAKGLKVIVEKTEIMKCGRFFKHNFCVKPYVPREPRRDPNNRRLNAHGVWSWSPESSWFRKVPLWGVWLRVLRPTLYDQFTLCMKWAHKHCRLVVASGGN